MSSQIIYETLLPTGCKKSVFQEALVKTLEHQQATLEGSIHLSFVTAMQSQKINLSNTGNDYATDVLSLRYPVDKKEKGQAAAEIVICTPIARQQAKQYNVSLQEEACLLFVHGLLHVLGRDHQTSQDQAKYQQTQNTIMNSLNLTARNMPWSH